MKYWRVFAVHSDPVRAEWLWPSLWADKHRDSSMGSHCSSACDPGPRRKSHERRPYRNFSTCVWRIT